MQLKQLKLAGFKSFVDPTIVPFPSQLVAVVGPNGCGKSNVIDAVRWVMGESSAKNLRGESMTDVIFNGSSNRKAVGQASVELVFDNSVGRLTGQYASYQEIAVKRVVTRDGESAYFLNGTRCRRRDITDIFLGTGAGTRGYSIIGQGTISRIVEARPEELRAFLEEAAGISKYKERRRETLTRLNHTRENLVRVADIRDELDKQLQRLERQAKNAERYQLLKSEEQQCKADILALKWRALNTELQLAEHELTQSTLVYEQHQTNSTEAYRLSVDVREKMHDDNQHYQDLQAAFYQMAAEIARLEENIQQQQREKQRLNNDQNQLHIDWQASTIELQKNTENLQESEQRFTILEQKIDSLQNDIIYKQQTWTTVQEQQKNWQIQTQEARESLAQASREVQVAQLKLQHIAQRRQETMLRLEKISDEQQRLNDDMHQISPDELRIKLPQLQQIQSQSEQQHQALLNKSQELRQQLERTEKSLQQEQDNFHCLNAEQAALAAVLQVASRAQINKIEHKEKVNYSRLLEHITVDKEWQYACESILGNGISAIIVDNLEVIWETLPQWQADPCMFMMADNKINGQHKYPTLADKIHGFKPKASPDLQKIFAASSLAEAQQWLADINDDESIITACGCWLGKGWLRLFGDADQSASLLAKQQQLNTLNEQLNESNNQLTALKTTRDELRIIRDSHEQQLTEHTLQLAQQNEQTRICAAEIKTQDRLLEQFHNTKNRLQDEQEELSSRIEELASTHEETDSILQSVKARHDQCQQQEIVLQSEKLHWDQTIATHKQALDEVQSLLQQLALQKERELLLMKQTKDNIVREEAQLQLISDRMESIAQQLLNLETPDSSLTGNLHEKLLRHTELEEKLAAQREQLDSYNRELEKWESQTKSEEKQAKTVQEKIQKTQLHMQTLMVRASGIIENLNELDRSIDSLLTSIPADLSVTIREQTLVDIVEKIKRLGAINLAAIEEYNVESQRKQHLDDQYNDLNEALLTLDAAIEKMDHETRQRLQQTFDEVNRAFQSLFPRLFGGGRAMLELTCDNLLEAGIVVMAQPPGKRNSTIHLLSGGEKAMTAVALVFAIFQLNPSPFCMLDEVDAPLDDVNVGRFCTLVKEMSQFVQFLFITHNKVTMELADHLIGVTMREPGVSRVVAVDVEQAIAMTDA